MKSYEPIKIYVYFKTGAKEYYTYELNWFRPVYIINVYPKREIYL